MMYLMRRPGKVQRSRQTLPSNRWHVFSTLWCRFDDACFLIIGSLLPFFCVTFASSCVHTINIHTRPRHEIQFDDGHARSCHSLTIISDHNPMHMAWHCQLYFFIHILCLYPSALYVVPCLFFPRVIFGIKFSCSATLQD
jgi:hypothetical protein